MNKNKDTEKKINITMIMQRYAIKILMRRSEERKEQEERIKNGEDDEESEIDNSDDKSEPKHS